LSTGKPSVSNLFFGQLFKQWFVSVGVPVSRDGTISYY